jgi:hypothetical protein
MVPPSQLQLQVSLPSHRAALGVMDPAGVTVLALAVAT